MGKSSAAANAAKVCALVVGIASIFTNSIIVGLCGVILALCFIAETIKAEK